MPHRRCCGRGAGGRTPLGRPFGAAGTHATRLFMMSRCRSEDTLQLSVSQAPRRAMRTTHSLFSIWSMFRRPGLKATTCPPSWSHIVINTLASYRLACIGALISIEAVGAYCHPSVVPARLTVLDAGILLPVGACFVIGMVAARRVGVWYRAGFGLAQAVVLLDVYRNMFETQLAEGYHYEVAAIWSAWTLAYTFFFTGATQVVGARRRVGRVPGYCQACGYDLRGLSQPRCPECGTPF